MSCTSKVDCSPRWLPGRKAQQGHGQPMQAVVHISATAAWPPRPTVYSTRASHLQATSAAMADYTGAGKLPYQALLLSVDSASIPSSLHSPGLTALPLQTASLPHVCQPESEQLQSVQHHHIADLHQHEHSVDGSNGPAMSGTCIQAQKLAVASLGKQTSSATLQPRPSRPTLDPQLLTNQIHHARSWLEVQQIFKERSLELNSFHLAAMLTSIAKLHRNQEQTTKYAKDQLHSFLKQISALLADLIPTASQRVLANSISAYGRLRFHPGPNIMHSLLEACTHKISDLDSISCGQVWHGLACLGHCPDDRFCQAFWQATNSQLRTYQTQVLSNILWAHAKLKLKPQPQCLDVLLDGICSKAQNSAPQALANVLWSLACMQEGTSHQQQVELLLRAVDQQLPNFASQDLANTIWALAKMNHNPGKKQLGRLMTQAYGGLKRGSPQEICNMLWGFAKLGYKPPSAWQIHAVTSIERKLGRFKASELGNLAWSLAILQAPCSSSFWISFFRASAPMLQEFGPQVVLTTMQDFTNILWALASLKIRPPETWLEAFVEESFTQLPHFESQHYSNSLWAFARLGRLPPSAWVERFFLDSYSKLITFKPQDKLHPMLRTWRCTVMLKLVSLSYFMITVYAIQELAELMYACGISRVAPPVQWVNMFLIASYSKLGSFQARALANMVWGMARIRFIPSKKWQTAVASRMADLADELNEQDWRAITLGFNTMAGKPPAFAQRASQDMQAAVPGAIPSTSSHTCTASPHESTNQPVQQRPQSTPNSDCSGNPVATPTAINWKDDLTDHVAAQNASSTDNYAASIASQPTLQGNPSSLSAKCSVREAGKVAQGPSTSSGRRTTGANRSKSSRVSNQHTQGTSATLSTETLHKPSPLTSTKAESPWGTSCSNNTSTGVQEASVLKTVSHTIHYPTEHSSSNLHLIQATLQGGDDAPAAAQEQGLLWSKHNYSSRRRSAFRKALAKGGAQVKETLNIDSDAENENVAHCS